ncbi:MAG: hypothetical protein ACE15C_10860 [Phycisphaerae bacterium]
MSIVRVIPLPVGLAFLAVSAMFTPARSLTAAPTAASASAPAMAGWSHIGGDAGMTKYCPDNIPAGELKQDYVKRFHSGWTQEAKPSPNYHYASAVLIRAGTAAVFTNDAPKKYVYWSDGVALTLFNWSTGRTTAKTDAPGGLGMKNDPLRNYSLHVGQHHGEIDSHHYTNSVFWGDDGRLYAKRGGDHFCEAAYDPAAGKWGRLEVLKCSPNHRNWGGDANAFLTGWRDLVVYCPGDTRNDSTYIAVDASEAAWKAGAQGAWKMDIGPYLPEKNKKGNSNFLRFCDYPKISPSGAAVVAGQFLDDAGNLKMCLQATSLADGKRMWDAQYDDAGRSNFGAAAPAYWWHSKEHAGFSAYYFPVGRVADYWRFIVTDDLYIFYNGAQAQTIRAAGIKDGKEKWTREVGEDHPALACHGGFLYVVGDRGQMKLDLRQGGKAVWFEHNKFAGDAGYVMGGEDPVYRPMVLTDDTLWFIDGSCISEHHRLVGMRTSDGRVVQTIDLAALVAKKPGERLLAVNDLAASEGRLGVLIGVRSEGDPHAAEKCNRIIYQDLYVFSSGSRRD